jgi:hypothetical protein
MAGSCSAARERGKVPAVLEQSFSGKRMDTCVEEFVSVSQRAKGDFKTAQSEGVAILRHAARDIGVCSHPEARGLRCHQTSVNRW